MPSTKKVGLGTSRLLLAERKIALMSERIMELAAEEEMEMGNDATRREYAWLKSIGVNSAEPVKQRPVSRWTEEVEEVSATIRNYETEYTLLSFLLKKKRKTE